MKEEMVLVIRRSLLESLGIFQGLQFDVDRYLPVMLARENNFFAPRSSAETDPSLKQIIPYTILWSAGKILRYKRGKKSGEQRLVAKGSIGIGGHMNDHDEGLFALDMDAYLAGVQREIDEELIVERPIHSGIAALINDDSTEVGQVHLGIIHIFELLHPIAEKRESMILNVEFSTPEQLRAERDTLETWSQICVDNLERLLERTFTTETRRDKGKQATDYTD
jgi:predicted NUDIX family phosphoesterase